MLTYLQLAVAVAVVVDIVAAAEQVVSSKVLTTPSLPELPTT